MTDLRDEATRLLRSVRLCKRQFLLTHRMLLIGLLVAERLLTAAHRALAGATGPRWHQRTLRVTAVL